MANIKRLRRLVTVLERVRSDPKRSREFNLDQWAQKTPSCGTHMCAVGWGATDRSLRQQGLRLGRISNDGLYDLTYGDLFDWDAVEAFFGLQPQEAEFLFNSGAYNSLTAMGPVIKRLKAFIAEHSLSAPTEGREDEHDR